MRGDEKKLNQAKDFMQKAIIELAESGNRHHARRLAQMTNNFFPASIRSTNKLLQGSTPAGKAEKSRVRSGTEPKKKVAPVADKKQGPNDGQDVNKSNANTKAKPDNKTEGQAKKGPGRPKKTTTKKTQK